jgi:hypothetical protein
MEESKNTASKNKMCVYVCRDETANLQSTMSQEQKYCSGFRSSCRTKLKGYLFRITETRIQSGSEETYVEYSE